MLQPQCFSTLHCLTRSLFAGKAQAIRDILNQNCIITSRFRCMIRRVSEVPTALIG